MNTQCPHVVIADLNDDYALRLEDKFLRMMRKNIELEIITNSEYFHEYFSVPVRIDVALISEELFDDDLSNQDIYKLFVLTEDNHGDKEGAISAATYVYKYTSLSHVFNQTMGDYSHLARSQEARQAPKAITFFSPVGGSGKTTLAAGVATCLQESGSKVLYIDAEYQQETGFLFGGVHYASKKVGMTLARRSEDPYEYLKDDFVHDVVDVMPPLASNIMMYNIQYDSYVALVEGALRSGDYDYVIVDTDSAFNSEKLELLQLSDAVVIPATQGVIAGRKVAGFLRGLDANGRGKCHLICNAFNAALPDELSAALGGNQAVEAYVSYNVEVRSMAASTLAQEEDIVAVMYLVR